MFTHQQEEKESRERVVSVWATVNWEIKYIIEVNNLIIRNKVDCRPIKSQFQPCSSATCP